MFTQTLQNKVALVTGGASGLGRAIAQRLRADGASVVITDSQTELGAQVAESLGLTFIPQDVCDERRWPEVVSIIETQHGGLSILVNNAGVLGSMARASPEHTELQEWRRIFSVNVEGAFLGCRFCIPAMRKVGSGSIINMSSVAGLLATPYATAYGASKAAVRQLTKSVAQYCAQEGLKVRCNSVHPGNVRTPLWDRQAEEVAKMRDVPVSTVVTEAEQSIPLGGFTDCEDVAAAVSFLASDSARHITGTKLLVDGGIVECDTFRGRG